MDELERLKARVDALEQQMSVLSKMAKTISDIEAAVCGNSSNAMTQESLIQIVKRHDSDLKELAPLKKMMYAIAFIVAIPAPIIYWLVHQLLSAYTGAK